jgi:hypothetical protein
MTTTTWTSAHLSALEAAIAKGVRSVSYGDRRVEYGSIDEMLKLRATMAAAIAGTDQGDGQIVFAGRVR